MSDGDAEGEVIEVLPDDELVGRVVRLVRQHFSESGRLEADDLDAVLELTDCPSRLVPRLQAALTAAGVTVEPRRAAVSLVVDGTSGAVAQPARGRREFDVRSEDQFLRRLESGPPRLLTAAEEVRLGRIVQACGAYGPPRPASGSSGVPTMSELGERARVQFEERNLRLVYWLARQHAGQGMEVEDLIQEGWFGLRRAVEKFDPERGLKFSTYATWWVHQSITRALADKSRAIRLPVHVVESLQKVMRVRERMLLETGRAGIRELAERTGFAPGKVKRMVRLARGPLSLDSPVGDGLNVLGDLLPSESVFEDSVERRALHDLVEQTLATLSDREREVVERRFGMGDREAETLEEIGRTWGVTRERVRQIEAKALEHLRSQSRREPLEHFVSA